MTLTSSSTISWTRENSAMRVPANVLSSSRICPKSAMDRSWRAWAWSRMERAICRVRSLLGVASALPAPLPESLEGNAPVSVGFEAACSHSRLYSSMVEGEHSVQHNGPVVLRWSTKTNPHWWLRPQFRGNSLLVIRD